MLHLDEFYISSSLFNVECICLRWAMFTWSSSIKVAVDKCILFFLLNSQKQHTKPVAIIQTIRNIVPRPAVRPIMAKTILSIIVVVTVLAIVVVIVLAIVGSVKLARVNRTWNKIKASSKFYY